MRTIDQISAEITDTAVIASQEIEKVALGQRPAVQMSMIQASERLPKLLEEMEELAIPSRLVGLFADGDKTSIDKAAKIVTKEGGVVLDAAQLYRSVVDLVEPSYSKDRNFCTTQYSLVIQKISQIATDLGYLEIQPPKFKEAICPDTASTLQHVKNCLRECGVGDQATKDLLTKSIVDAIVRNKISSSQIPVMVIGANSVQERNAISVLFSRSVNYTFLPEFVPTVAKVAALFKEQKQKNLEEEKD